MSNEGPKIRLRVLIGRGFAYLVVAVSRIGLAGLYISQRPVFFRFVLYIPLSRNSHFQVPPSLSFIVCH